MYCRALRSACTVLPSTGCFCISPAGERVHVHKAWSQRLASWPQWGSKWVDFRSPVRKPCWATAEPKSTHFWTHLSSLKPVDRAAGPVRALTRGARQVHPLHHTSPTLPAWQPLAPQRAGPSAGITPVPMSGRARGAWPLSHPPSLLSAPNLVLGEHALPAEIQAAQRLWEQYDLWDS